MLPAADAGSLALRSGSRSLRRTSTVTFADADDPASCPATRGANDSSSEPAAADVFLADLPPAAAGAIQQALLLAAAGSQDAELEVELVLHHDEEEEEDDDAPPAAATVARLVRTPSGRGLQRTVSRGDAAAGPPLSPTGLEVWPRRDASSSCSHPHVSSLLRVAAAHVQQAAAAESRAQAARACPDHKRGQQHAVPASGHLNIRPVEAAVTGLLTPLLAAELSCSADPAAEAEAATDTAGAAVCSALGVASRAFSPGRQGRYQRCAKAAEPQGAVPPQAAEEGCLLLDTLLELLAALKPSARQALRADRDTRALLQGMLADAASCGGSVTDRATALAALLTDSAAPRCPPTTELPGPEQQQQQQQQPATHHPWLAWSLGSCREHTPVTSQGSAHSWLSSTGASAASASLAGLRGGVSGQQAWRAQLLSSTGLAPATTGSRYRAAAPVSASHARSASAAMAAARDKLHERKLHALLSIPSESGTKAEPWSERTRAWSCTPAATTDGWQPRFTAAGSGLQPGALQHLLSPWSQRSLERHAAPDTHTTAQACAECGLSMSICCGCSAAP